MAHYNSKFRCFRTRLHSSITIIYLKKVLHENIITYSLDRLHHCNVYRKFYSLSEHELLLVGLFDAFFDTGHQLFDRTENQTKRKRVAGYSFTDYNSVWPFEERHWRYCLFYASAEISIMYICLIIAC